MGRTENMEHTRETRESKTDDALNKRIEHSIGIGVPARTAYDQWTQFEDFPKIVDCVESVQQIDERTVSWTVHACGRRQTCVIEIVEQIPGKRIAWRGVEPAHHAGVATFHRIADDECRVMLQMGYETEGLVESAADALGILRRTVEQAMKEIASFLEERGEATGAWKGSIPSKDER